MDEIIEKMQKILDSLKGNWLSKNDSFIIETAFSEHMNKMTFGFFGSILTCNEIKDEDLIIRIEIL